MSGKILTLSQAGAGNRLHIIYVSECARNRWEDQAKYTHYHSDSTPRTIMYMNSHLQDRAHNHFLGHWSDAVLDAPCKTSNKIGNAIIDCGLLDNSGTSANSTQVLVAMTKSCNRTAGAAACNAGDAGVLAQRATRKTSPVL